MVPRSRRCSSTSIDMPVPPNTVAGERDLRATRPDAEPGEMPGSPVLTKMEAIVDSTEVRMARQLVPSSWTVLLARFRDAAARRSWTIEANEGIIATAGILLGFARAGASNRVLLFTAAGATIAGGVGVGGAEWAEDAAERESQLVLAEREQQEIATNPHAEVDELAAYWESKGLAPDLAHQVAEQLSARDALAAQLDWEYGFDEPMPRYAPLWTG